MFRWSEETVKILPVGLDSPALATVSAAARDIHDMELLPAAEELSALGAAVADATSGGMVLLDSRLATDRDSMSALPPEWLLIVIASSDGTETPEWLSEEAFLHLSRPLDPQLTRDTLESGKAYIRATEAALRLGRLYESASNGIQEVGREPRYVVSEDQNRIRLIKVDDIRWVEAAGNYMRLHTEEGSFLVRATMKSLASSLDDRFLRIHRSHLVNREYIRELRPVRDGSYDVLLDGGTRVRMSRSYRDALEDILARGI